MSRNIVVMHIIKEHTETGGSNSNASLISAGPIRPSSGWLVNCWYVVKVKFRLDSKLLSPKTDSVMFNVNPIKLK